MTPDWKRTLYLLAFVQLVSAIGFSSIFPFLPLYIKTLDTTSGLGIETLAGLVYSVPAFTMMVAAPIWGALADRHGRKPMVVRATIGAAIITALMAFATSAEQLVGMRAVQGMVSGVVSANTALVADVIVILNHLHAVAFSVGLEFMHMGVTPTHGVLQQRMQIVQPDIFRHD